MRYDRTAHPLELESSHVKSILGTVDCYGRMAVWTTELKTSQWESSGSKEVILRIHVCAENS